MFTFNGGEKKQQNGGENYRVEVVEVWLLDEFEMCLVFLLISQVCNLVVLNHTLSNTALAAQKQIEETNPSQSNLFEINSQEKVQ